MNIDLNSFRNIIAISYCAILLCIGCNEPTTVATSVKESNKFVLNTEPVAATKLGTAQNQISESKHVVLKGWVDLKAFESGGDRALFMLREILEENSHGGEAHDPSSCPFCKRRMDAAPKAAVVFKGDDDKILSKKPSSLFPIEHGDIVVVKGEADMDEKMEIMKVTASGIYFN